MTVVHTFATTHYPCIQTEAMELQQVVDNMNVHKGSMEEMFERNFNILGITPGIRHVNMAVVGTRIEVVVGVFDTRRTRL